VLVFAWRCCAYAEKWLGTWQPWLQAHIHTTFTHANRSTCPQAFSHDAQVHSRTSPYAIEAAVMEHAYFNTASNTAEWIKWMCLSVVLSSVNLAHTTRLPYCWYCTASLQVSGQQPADGDTANFLEQLEVACRDVGFSINVFGLATCVHTCITVHVMKGLSLWWTFHCEPTHIGGTDISLVSLPQLLE
jgi:hypothetical protein